MFPTTNGKTTAGATIPEGADQGISRSTRLTWNEM